jgi:exonuclease III
MKKKVAAKATKVAGKCKICKENIGTRQNWLLCFKCGGRFHRICLPSISHLAFAQQKKTLWECSTCKPLPSVSKGSPTWNEDCFPPVDLSDDEVLSSSQRVICNATNSADFQEFNSCVNFNSIKGLKFAHLNINGLRTKFDDLKSFLITHNFNIFSLNELRLPKHFKSSFYEITNYTFIPFINSIRGGSCFYIRKDCAYNEVKFLTCFPEYTEVNILNVKFPYTKPILIINIYNSPAVDKLNFLNSLNALLIELSQHDRNILIMGDLNINLLDNNSHSYLLKSLAKQFNLDQFITSPTRIDKQSETLLDHVYGSHFFRNSYSGTFDLTDSDHKGVFLIKHNKVPKIPYKIISIRKYANLNFEKVSSELLNIDWSELTTMNNADDILHFFESQVLDILNSHAPITKRRVKGIRNPWMTQEIMKLRIERAGLKRIWHKSKCLTDHSNYKHFKHFVQNRINKAKRDYFLNKCDEALTSAKVWNVYNELSNFKLKRSDPIHELYVNDKILTDPPSICDALSAVFTLPGSNESEDIQGLTNTINVTQADIEDLLSPDLIKSSFQSLKPSTSSDSEIPYCFLKRFIDQLSFPITLIFSRFLQIKRLPSLFKSATITPIFKGKGSRTDPSNYRPISVLPVLSKLFEKVIYRKLYHHVENENLLDSQQHGFRKHRSCATALSLFSHDILTHLDSPNITAGIVFVDLKKAFDSIRPLRLLQLLRDIGIPPIILLYLCTYFTTRTYKIKLNNFISELYDLVRGCPQGSILAPILFSLFYNGVGSSLLSAFYYLFADDLCFYLFNSNTNSLITDLSLIMNNLNSWCETKDLVINFSKTKLMLISKRSITHDIPDLICAGHIIERVNEFKYLGIIFDSTMTFDSHFQYVCKRISSAAGCLNLIKRYLNLRVFKVLINSFLLSIIDYGLPIWGKISNSRIHILQSKVNSVLGAYFYPQICNKFQKINRITHITEHKQYFESNIDYNSLYDQCNILSISERLKYFYAVFVFKSINFPHIPEISKKFSFSNSTRNHTLLVPSHNTKFFEKSIFYQSILLWNKLDTDARKIDLTLAKFSETVNQWLLNERNSEFVAN